MTDLVTEFGRLRRLIMARPRIVPAKRTGGGAMTVAGSELRPSTGPLVAVTESGAPRLIHDGVVTQSGVIGVPIANAATATATVTYLDPYEVFPPIVALTCNNVLYVVAASAVTLTGFTITVSRISGAAATTTVNVWWTATSRTQLSN